MIDEIFKKNRPLRIASKSFSRDTDLDLKLKQYISDYLSNLDISSDEIIDQYWSFIDEYIKSCEEFKTSGLYPYQYRELKDFQRSFYDIALLLSLLVAEHRYSIISEFASLNIAFCKKVLVIGVGSGIELDILLGLEKNDHLEIDAYDLSIGEYVKNRFSQSINLFEEKFEGSEPKYDLIIAIELLEHITAPLELLASCFESLNENGLCFVTTATNMPQEDHLYNFDNATLFESQCADIGFQVEQKKDINHKGSLNSIQSKNTIYRFKK